MYNEYNNPYPYFMNTPCYNYNPIYNAYNAYPYSYRTNNPMHTSGYSKLNDKQYAPYTKNRVYDTRFNMQYARADNSIELIDYGPEPFAVNIDEATKQNNNFRTSMWTGDHLQLTLMSIDVGEDIGLEMHPDVDQFIRIEEGQGIVRMGDSENNLDYQENVYDDFAIIIPAGKWHNLINTGNEPLKLYSIYAPPQHPHGTVHNTKEEAEASEEIHQ